MIESTSARLTALIAGTLVFFVSGVAFAGLGPVNEDCAWGVARDQSGNFKFFFDSDQDGVSEADFVFGTSTSAILIGDWNNNGLDNVAIRRDISGSGKFFFDTNFDATAELAFVLGEAAAVPVSGDWDGDGDDNVGVRRDVNNTGKFFLDFNGDNIPEIDFVFGTPADIPVVGNWDGDNDDNIGIVRTVNGGLRWFFATDAGAVDDDFAFGTAGDLPIVGDWDDDGDDDPGLVRDVNGAFRIYLDPDHNGGATNGSSFVFGTAATDTPIVCNFSGAGDEFGVARTDGGALRFITTANLDGVQTLRVRFGNAGDTPFTGLFE